MLSVSWSSNVLSFLRLSYSASSRMNLSKSAKSTPPQSCK